MIRTATAFLLTAMCCLSAADAIRVIKDAKEFDAAIASTKGIVVVDFHAEWCGPCKMLGPILEEVTTENAGKVTLLKVDVDQNAELAQRFAIEAIPAVYTFKDGKQVSQKVGMMDKAAVVKFIGL